MERAPHFVKSVHDVSRHNEPDDEPVEVSGDRFHDSEGNPQLFLLVMRVVGNIQLSTNNR